MTNIVNVGYHSTNYYAIDVRGGRLLVDCGWPGSLSQFTAQMKRKGISPSEIKYLLVTHFHPDHAGLVDEFKQLGARLILLESQVGALEPTADPTASGIPSFVHISAENNNLLKFKDSRRFLSSLDLAGEIIPTPGHSDDSVTLILDDGSAFTGDLPPRFLIADNDTVTKASWDTIYRHQITRVFPAHGN
jgi:ribonuclease/clavin/mitogillin